MALVRPGSEISHERGPRRVPRHHHVGAYAAIVLRGDYVEAGDHGRFRAEAGTVLLHNQFHAHLDHFGARGADILNLPLSQVARLAIGRVDDPDALVRIAERDKAAAEEMLFSALHPVQAGQTDWPDQLAADLAEDRVASLTEWAEVHCLAPSSVSRGFRACYGVSPQRFRLELRTGRAARAARGPNGSLAAVAADAGFADQAHLSRSVRRFYGASLSRLLA